MIDQVATINDEEPARILIIDDEKSNVKIMREILRDLGEVFFALEPVAGLEMAPKVKPDIILLDIEMPGLSGYEVCSRLKADAVLAEIPVIFVTSNDATEDEERGLKAGALDFIAKPLRPAIVRARVRNQLLLQQTRKQLIRLATTDGLTACYNRRHFMTFAKAEIARSRRHGHPLALAVFDLDYFKQVNDTWGHAAGDAVLVEIASVVRDLCRETDVFARIGGEEFAILLPDTDISGAQVFTERLRVRLASNPVQFEDQQITVTASFGLTEIDPEKDTIDAALLRADTGAYQAKSLGRNRVEVVANGSTLGPK